VPAIQHFVGKLPILGVCLGHQSIGAAWAAHRARATQMHGKTSVITTDRRGVYAGLPEKFTVIRYHSLVIERASLPARWRSPPPPRMARSWACATPNWPPPMRRWRACSSTPSRSCPSTAAMLRNFLAMGRVKEAA
jgi:anthranilate synthase component 2